MLKLHDFYQGGYYTPMPEMHNLGIPVTAGCDYNQCRYCDLNHLQPFQHFPLDKIKHYITDEAAFYHDQRRKPSRFTLLEGNALCRDTDDLLTILGYLQSAFQVDYVSTFARSYDILRKSPQDLVRLHQAGLDRISIGIETGSDTVLRYQQKGVSAKHQLVALQKLEEAGIRYTCYIMLGLGGRQWSQDHAQETASFLNQVHPEELTIVTIVLFKGADLVRAVRSGEFQRLTARESLLEMRQLLEGLELTTLFNATHPTNALSLKGRLPEHKALLLAKLNHYLDQHDSHQIEEDVRLKWQTL